MTAKKATSKKEPKINTVKNNSAFKRAMFQINIRPGEKVRMILDDGSNYIVEFKK